MPLSGMEPTIWACPLTKNQMGKLSVHRMTPNNWATLARALSFFGWQISDLNLSQASWGVTWPQVWGWTVVWAGSQTEHSINLFNSQEHALLGTSPRHLLLLCQLPAPYGPVLCHMDLLFLIHNVTSSFHYSKSLSEMVLTLLAFSLFSNSRISTFLLSLYFIHRS